MESKPTSTQKLNSLRPVYCSPMGKLIMAEVSNTFDIPNGRVTWFQCEACGGWHIMIDNQLSPHSTLPSNPTGNVK
jgi:hypothetical protein